MSSCGYTLAASPVVVTSTSILLLGGNNAFYQPSNQGRFLRTVELIPPVPGCVLPLLPNPTDWPAAFTTNSETLAFCGGVSRPGDCYVLDTTAMTWKQKDEIPDLRAWTAGAVTLDAGVFIMGSYFTPDKLHQLAPGSSEWLTTSVPYTIGPCMVPINQKSFLLIGGRGRLRQVREYNSDTGWQPADKWPQLTVGRQNPGCSKVGNFIIVAGGMDGDFTQPRKSTDIINISEKTITSKPENDMTMPRMAFALKTINNIVYALGGWTGESATDSIERWDASTGVWKTDSAMRFPVTEVHKKW